MGSVAWGNTASHDTSASVSIPSRSVVVMSHKKVVLQGMDQAPTVLSTKDASLSSSPLTGDEVSHFSSSYSSYCGPTPTSVIDSAASPVEPADFWWREVGLRTNHLLALCGYSQDAMDQHARFICSYIIPALGDPPTISSATGLLRPTFPSYMCDDYSPIEYGIAWTKPDKPCPRFAIEAISPSHVLESTGGINLTASYQLMNQLEAGGHADFILFRKLVSLLTIDLPASRAMYGCAVKSQTFFGFDLTDGDPRAEKEKDRRPRVKVKAHVMPWLKAHQFGLDAGELLLETLESGDLPHSSCAAMRLVCGYLRSLKGASRPEPYILSVDAHADDPRLKLYVRFRTVDFHEILAHLTLGDRLKTTDWITPLRRFWELTLGHDPLSTADTKDAADATMRHLTSGTLLYYDLKPGEDLPHSKIYLPVRHWADDDASVAEGLQQFLDEAYEQRNAQPTTAAAETAKVNVSTSIRYPDVLRKAFEQEETTIEGDEGGCATTGKGRRPLRQNYVSLGSKADGTFTVTVYISPQLFAGQ